jgi:hypothetical protein
LKIKKKELYVKKKKSQDMGAFLRPPMIKETALFKKKNEADGPTGRMQ